ncbi:MAG: TMEM175 family protein [Nocardioides sp.]
MSTSRLEAFSDGVLAIVITVMVLELKPPGHPDLHSLVHDSGLGLLTYVLSFIYIGIYWSNHHHMFQICNYVDGSVLWANLHLLFWLSLYPFTTTWVAESDLKQTPTVVYGVNLLAAGVAYYLLQIRMTQMPEGGERLREVVGDDLKGKLSPVIYASGIALAFVEPWLGAIPFVVVALMWLVPDRRVERYLQTHRELRD